MRDASSDFAAALEGSFDLQFEADLYYGDERRFTNLPVDAPSFSWDGSADVEGTGSCTVLWTDDQGTSLKPTDAQDWLAPFGTRLVFFARLKDGPIDERVQLGVFLLTSIPQADDDVLVWQQTRITVGSTVDVNFTDRMTEVQRDRFAQLAQPSQLASVYAELAVLTGFQITKTIADGAITRSVVYEEDRIKAIQDLAAIINGVPFMESDGTLSLRDLAPGGVVAALKVGEQGTISQIGSSLSADGVYNGIIIRGETDTQGAILAEKWIEHGPLAATPDGGQRTPFHRVPKFYSSPFITTQQQADSAIDGLLDSISVPRAAQLSVQCIVNPLLQVGDVVTVDDGEKFIWRLRLTLVTLGGGAYMTVNGDVLSRDLR